MARLPQITWVSEVVKPVAKHVQTDAADDLVHVVLDAQKTVEHGVQCREQDAAQKADPGVAGKIRAAGGAEGTHEDKAFHTHGHNAAPGGEGTAYGGQGHGDRGTEGGDQKQTE
ncbi:MAG: hypothetical protein V8R55_07110 [Dysosmobacter sp.]